MRSLFNRIFGRRNAEVSSTQIGAFDGPVQQEQVGWLQDQIRRDIASGFYDEAIILTNAVDAFEDEIDPTELRSTAQRMLRAAIADHAAAQPAWPARTDWNRLEDAFAALEVDGIVSRHNFSCCGTCGSAEIWDEVEAVNSAGGSARGYAFYHMQDTESAVDGHGLYLNYGACEDGEEAALAVANEIVSQLEAHELETNWSGSWNQRIGVSLDWKRRR